MAINEFLKHQNKTALTITAKPEGNYISKDGVKAPKPDGLATTDATGMAHATLQETVLEDPTENIHPLRRAFWWPGRSQKLLPTLIHFMQKSTRREIAPEEKAIEDERKRRREMEKLLREEARIIKQLMINTLNRLGICYRYKQNERDFNLTRVKPVHFDQIIMQPDAFYFRIDTAKLPYGVSIMQLMDEMVLNDLSICVHHRVSCSYSEKNGAWYIVERASGKLGIPNHVMLADLWARFPKSADGLTIPLGMTHNSKPVYVSLDNMPHMLVGGTTGAGKSNALNVILCTLIRRNTPGRLKFVMVDLKGGLEFSFYEKIPHILRIVEERENVPEALAWLIQELERRIKIIREAGMKEIGRYNQAHRHNALSRIVLVIDEWADIKMMKDRGAQAEDHLTNIAARGRAVGIHCIVCTQSPKSEIINTRIKGVLPAKLAFSCPTVDASKVIIGNGNARGLSPEGRAIYQHKKEFQVQLPFISDAMVRQTVADAISGHQTSLAPEGHDVTPEEIRKWALENDTGYLSRTKLFKLFGPRGITKAELEGWLMEWEGKEFVIGSSLYRVDPAAGTRPRRLIAIDETLEGKEDTNADDQTN